MMVLGVVRAPQYLSKVHCDRRPVRSTVPLLNSAAVGKVNP